MIIERTESEIIFRLPLDIEYDIKLLQGVIDYFLYKEATKNSQATQEEVDSLVNEVKKGWWAQNRSRLVK